MSWSPFWAANFYWASRIVVGSGDLVACGLRHVLGEGHGSLLRVPNWVHRIDGIFTYTNLPYKSTKSAAKYTIIYCAWILCGFRERVFLIHGDIDMFTWLSDQADLGWCIFLEMDAHIWVCQLCHNLSCFPSLPSDSGKGRFRIGILESLY